MLNVPAYSSAMKSGVLIAPDVLSAPNTLTSLAGTWAHGANVFGQGFGSSRSPDMIRQAAEDVVIVNADNVAAFFHERGSGLDPYRDIPVLAPPFPAMWIEHVEFNTGLARYFSSRVSLIGSEQFEDWDAGRDESEASMRAIREWTNATRERLEDETGVAFFGEAVRDRQDAEELPGIVGPVRWAICVLNYGYSPKLRRTVELNRVTNFYLAPDGSVARLTDGTLAVQTASHVPIDGLGVMSQADPVALLTLAFMNCRNVTVQDHLPTRQQRRALQRQGDPVVTFKTLTIEPMRRVLSSEGQMDQVGLKKALHICRGHFAHYSDDKPLFGKYSGQFWRPAHVRGTTEAGEVVKDYAVRAPKGRAA